MSPKRLPTAALVVYALALALGLGVGSAYVALGGEYPVGRVKAGAWTAWPHVGSRDVDPYARSIVVRAAEVPLAAGEGIAFTATVDSAGRPLDSACAYRVGPTAPQARLWTLTLYDQGGQLVRSELQRSGFTSAEVLRSADGQFGIVLSRDVRAGDWLQLPPAGPFTLVLRLYDSPVAAGTAAIDVKALPPVERMECAA